MGMRILGAVVLGIMGFSALGWTWYTMALVNRMQRWPTSKGDMIAGEAVPVESGSGFRMQVRYEFTLDGQRHEGTTFGIQDRSFSKREADQLAKRYAPDRMVIVYHDPTDPTRSFIYSKESQLPMVVGGIGLALVFIAVWLVARPWLD
jgi:hypothetical protein